jgi:hypothetical protein
MSDYNLLWVLPQCVDQAILGLPISAKDCPEKGELVGQIPHSCTTLKDQPYTNCLIDPGKSETRKTLRDEPTALGLAIQCRADAPVSNSRPLRQYKAGHIRPSHSNWGAYTRTTEELDHGKRHTDQFLQ